MSETVERAPAHRRTHGLERIQVQAAATLALLAVYFRFWTLFAPPDPLAPITFLAVGRSWPALGLVGFLCVLGAVVAAATLSSRREGALLALLIGAGGISLRSPGAGDLLWLQAPALGRTYLKSMEEVVLLWCGLAAAAVVIDLVRGVLGRLCPGWVWKSPLADVSEEDRARSLKEAQKAETEFVIRHGWISGLVRSLGIMGTQRAGVPTPPRKAMWEALQSLALALVLSGALLHITLQSGARGQILFSLAASFAVGVFIAHQCFPTPYSIVAWCLPLVAALFFYALAAAAPVPATVQGWTHVAPFGRVLPIDWLTAGGGGAVLGYWLSWRIHELRLIEKGQKKQP